MATNDPSRPSWCIIKTNASIGKNPGPTTADCETPKGTIQASFWPEHPPLPSNLYVDCPDLGDSPFREDPLILGMVDDLLLLRVAFASPERRFIAASRDYDYFIYRADPKRRLLKMLPHPHPIVLHVDQLGLLPRGDHFIVATLLSTTTWDIFKLYLLDSEDGSSWISKTVTVSNPLRDIEFPFKIPKNCRDLLYHVTNTVITLGGGGGCIGWVDLWRGILFCNVLAPDPVLQFVRLPLPMKQLQANQGRGVILGCPKPRRGIAYIKSKDCLKFVELEYSIERLPCDDDETGLPSLKVDGWSITTYSNKDMSDDWDAWKLDFTAKSDKMDSKYARMIFELMHCEPSQDSEATADRSLQNLFVSDPTPSLDGKEIIYLMSRAKFLHPKAWILAINMEKSALQGMALFDTQTPRHAAVIYCPGSVFTTSQGGADAGVMQQGGDAMMIE